MEEDETLDDEDPAPARGETGHQQWVTLSRGEKSKPDFVSHYIASDSDVDVADDESPTDGAFTKWFYSWRNWFVYSMEMLLVLLVGEDCGWWL